VRGRPLLVVGLLLGEQFLSPVAQRRGPLIVFGVGGGNSFAADLPAEITGPRTPATTPQQ
jgi:hypothetical protein